MTTKSELHKKMVKQSIRRTNYLLDGLARGEDPNKLTSILERRDAVGSMAEELVMEVVKDLPDVNFVEKTRPFDDRTKGVDLRVGVSFLDRRENILIQVKTSKGGFEEFLKEKSRQFGESDMDRLQKRLLQKNFMVIVVGGVGLPEEIRIEAIKNQFNGWMARKRESLG